MKIILYDIDGTLVNMSGAGFSSLKKAWKDIHGVDIDAIKIIPDGRTDFGMFTEISDFFSLNDCDFRKIMERYASLLSENLKTNRKVSLLPGIERNLKVLAGVEGVVQGLMTGNIYEGARIKLEYFDLFDYFMFGAFGDIHKDRNSLAEFALSRLRHLYGDSISGSDVIIVGDTPWDIKCGKLIGAVTAGVATGKYDREDLEAENPDIVFDDLEDCAGFLNFVMK